AKSLRTGLPLCADIGTSSSLRPGAAAVSISRLTHPYTDGQGRLKGGGKSSVQVHYRGTDSEAVIKWDDVPPQAVSMNPLERPNEERCRRADAVRRTQLCSFA